MAGRLSYTDDVADAICERLSDGESLRSICAAEGMPDKATVFRWLNSVPAFCDQYARAREAQADALVDEIIDIADDGSNDWMEKRDSDGQMIGWKENGEAIRRSALRVDARKWTAGKLRPKKYGDSSTINTNVSVADPLMELLTSVAMHGKRLGHGDN